MCVMNSNPVGSPSAYGGALSGSSAASVDGGIAVNALGGNMPVGDVEIRERLAAVAGSLADAVQRLCSVGVSPGLAMRVVYGQEVVDRAVEVACTEVSSDDEDSDMSLGLAPGSGPLSIITTQTTAPSATSSRKARRAERSRAYMELWEKTADVDGQCYLRLFKVSKRKQVLRMLGRSPAVRDILGMAGAWFDVEAMAGLWLEEVVENVYHLTRERRGLRCDVVVAATSKAYRWLVDDDLKRALVEVRSNCLPLPLVATVGTERAPRAVVSAMRVAAGYGPLDMEVEERGIHYSVDVEIVGVCDPGVVSAAAKSLSSCRTSCVRVVQAGFREFRVWMCGTCEGAVGPELSVYRADGSSWAEYAMSQQALERLAVGGRGGVLDRTPEVREGLKEVMSEDDRFGLRVDECLRLSLVGDTVDPDVLLAVFAANGAVSVTPVAYNVWYVDPGPGKLVGTAVIDGVDVMAAVDAAVRTDSLVEYGYDIGALAVRDVERVQLGSVWRVCVRLRAGALTGSGFEALATRCAVSLSGPELSDDDIVVGDVPELCPRCDLHDLCAYVMMDEHLPVLRSGSVVEVFFRHLRKYGVVKHEALKMLFQLPSLYGCCDDIRYRVRGGVGVDGVG